MALRRGDVVEVRSAAEILSTLDERGAFEALPFMAEMIPYCGQRLTVDALAERLCDMVDWSGSRRIPDTVLLGQLRCGGSGHDGCQGECRFLWKEVWLRRAEPGSPLTRAPDGEENARGALQALVAANTRQPSTQGQPGSRYRCQITELQRASGPTSGFPYARALTSGNVELGRYSRVIARALVWESRRKIGWWSKQVFSGTSSPVQRPPLDLRPGEWVRIRPAREIAETIDRNGFTRGIWFDREMLQYCGRTFQVKERVSRFIRDDGSFVEMNGPAVKLEGVTCTGNFSGGRWFCARANLKFWWEDWLERAPAPPPA